MVDTDHLAACVLTKMALATCDSVVVPLSFDDGDFNRLFQDVTGNSLFTDVMIPMRAKSQLRARVAKCVFTKVSSNKNEETRDAGRHPLAVQAVQHGHGADGRDGAAGLERVHARR